MNSNKKPAYRFSIIRMIHSIWSTIFSNAWRSWFFMFIASLLVVAIWMSLSQNYLTEYNFTPVIDSLALAIMFGTWGYLGYQAEKNRFFPHPITNNVPGVGLALMVIGWGFMIYLLYLTVSKLIELF